MEIKIATVGDNGTKWVDVKKELETVFGDIIEIIEED